MLKTLWERWKIIAEKIGTFQAKVILGLLYFVLLGPVALVRRLVADPLGLRRTEGATHWIPRPSAEATLEGAQKQ
jgi:hypothetical protein